MIDNRSHETAFLAPLVSGDSLTRGELRDEFSKRVNPFEMVQYYNTVHHKSPNISINESQRAINYVFNKLVSWMSTGRTPPWIERVYTHPGTKSADRLYDRYRITQRGLAMANPKARVTSNRSYAKAMGYNASETASETEKPERRRRPASRFPEHAVCELCGEALSPRDPSSLARLAANAYARARREGGFNHVSRYTVEGWVHEYCLEATETSDG